LESILTLQKAFKKSLKQTSGLKARSKCKYKLSEIQRQSLARLILLEFSEIYGAFRLVGGAGQVKLTKDGAVLLHEMQIQHPTAAMIGRAATAQDEIVGDGTTTNVLFIGELMRQAERYIGEAVHPRILVDGMELAKTEALKFLETFRHTREVDRDLLIEVARTSLNTKIQAELANQLTEVCVDAVKCI
jgi:T-complex protein 1 subunit zeta